MHVVDFRRNESLLDDREDGRELPRSRHLRCVLCEIRVDKPNKCRNIAARGPGAWRQQEGQKRAISVRERGRVRFEHLREYLKYIGDEFCAKKSLMSSHQKARVSRHKQTCDVFLNDERNRSKQSRFKLGYRGGICQRGKSSKKRLSCVYSGHDPTPTLPEKP